MQRDGYLALAYRRRWVLIAAFLVGAIAAAGLSALRQPTYAATAHLLLVPDDPHNSLNGTNAPRFLTADAEDRYVAAQVEIIKSGAVVNAAAKAEGIDTPTPQLTSSLNVGSSAGSDVVDIAVSNGDPARARDLANAVANAFIANRRAYGQQALRTQIDALTKQLDSLQALASHDSDLLSGANDPTERAGLEASRTAALSKYQAQFLIQQDLILQEQLQTGGAQLVKPAALPSAPTSPQPVRDGLLGGVIALLLAWGVIVLQARGRVTVSADTDFARDGLELLCTIDERHLSTRGLGSSNPSRDLRIAMTRVVDRIEFRTRADNSIVVAVEGVATAGSASLLAMNLAIACAEAGTATLLLTADSRGDLTGGRRSTGADPTGTEAIGTRIPNLYVGNTPTLRAVSETTPDDVLSAVAPAIEIVVVDVETLGRTEADLVVLVAEAGRTPEHQLRGVKGDSDRKAQVIGLVLLSSDLSTRMAS